MPTSVFPVELDIINKPLATIVALKALPLTDSSYTIKNGVAVFVIETQKLYQWNATSTVTPNDVTIVQSNHSTTGRWIVVNKNYVESNQLNAYYAGNNGNDSNDGKSLQTRKLNFDSAITAAKTQTIPPSADNRVNIYGIDGGNYTKFDLTGPGFISLIAPHSTIDVTTTIGSPGGITIDDGFAVDLGFLRHKLAEDDNQAGILLKCNVGSNVTYVNAKQIINNTAYTDVLFESAGSKIFASIADLRQVTNRGAQAVFVSNGALSLTGNKRIRGKITVAAGKTAYIETMDYDGDIAVEGNGILHIRGNHWNGDIVTAGIGSTIIHDFYTHTIP